MSIEKDPPNYSLENLPEELIEDILLRLRVPVKHLLQLKLVCKSWKSIISHPRFAKHHLLLSSTTHHQFVSSIPGHSKIQIFSFNSLLENPPNLLNSDRNLILGSCNGIVCMCDTYEWSLTLFNPSTGFTFTKLIKDLVRGFFFDSFHGFGYDHVNDKYKLLLVKRDLNKTVTEIYTFGENFSVRVVENSPLRPHRNAWLGKCVNGTLNWITPKIGPNYNLLKEWMILSFNLATETFGEVLLPCGNSDNICKPMMNLVHNCLCVCFFHCDKVCLNVWIMKEYGVQDSWTKLMTTSKFYLAYDLPCTCREEHYYCRGDESLEPLSVTEDGLVLFKTQTWELIVYNSKDGTYNSSGFMGDIWIYHESLVSPS